MTEKESRKLRAGDAVAFADGVGGVVEQVGHVGVMCLWDDGQRGVIHHDDMQDVARSAATIVTPCKSQSPGEEPGPNSLCKSGDGGQT